MSSTSSPTPPTPAPHRTASASAREVIAAVKPRLRGWIHAGTAPLALAACIVLTVLAPGTGLTWACAIYLTCSLLLFANSGVYHIGTGHWSAKVAATLRRIDHANIYLLIAGTYTPLSAALLPTRTAALVLGIVWVGAAIGTATNLLWMSAPRWFTTALYIILGWVAVWFLRRDLHTGRSRLRPQDARPLTALVRLPRDLPRMHRGRMGLPVRGLLPGGAAVGGPSGRGAPPRRRVDYFSYRLS